MEASPGDPFRDWTVPVNLGPEVNDSLPNCRPSVTAGGDTLYFQTEREGGYGGEDIWMTVRNGEEWGTPENLGPNVNSRWGDSKPYISADGRTLFFTSQRPGGYGGTDLYVSFHSDSGWNPAVLLDPPVNSPFNEGAVSLSFDGERLYFQSNRPGGYGNYDIWVSTGLGDGWGTPVNLGPVINTSNVDWFALEEPNGDRLYITQLRPGGYGDQDLWYCEKDGDAWSIPVNAELPLNEYITCSPTMTGDGGKLFFGGGHLGEGYGDLDLWLSLYRGEPFDTLFLPEVDDPDAWERTADIPGARVVLSLVEASEHSILAGTYPGGKIARTSDEGDHWEIVAELPGAICVFSLLRTTEGAILAGTFPLGDVFRSTDGGSEWMKTGELEGATEIHCLYEARDGTIFAGTAPHGTVFASHEGGVSWVASEVGPDADAVSSLLETADGTLLAGTYDWTGLFRSTDRGVSWEEIGDFGEEINHPSIGSLLELESGDLLAGHLSRGHGSGRGVHRSTDGGGTWFESGFIPRPLNEVYSLISTQDGHIYAGIATTHDYIVYRSTDQGFHWERTGMLTGARETLCLLESSDGTIYAGTSPNGDVYRLKDGTVGGLSRDDQESGEPKAPNPLLGQNFPNPFNPTTVIPYSLSRSSSVELVIYNVLGQRVKTLVDGPGTAGEHRVSWDGRDERGEHVASGIYFLSLRACDTESLRKILLLR